MKFTSHYYWFLASGICCFCVLLGVCRGDLEQCTSYAPPAVIRGKKFFNSVSGEYISIKGINYYPRPNEGDLTQTNSIDFFTEQFRNVWERDIEYFKRLNINVVRVYAVQPGVSHDAFMCALQSAGIYVIVGLAADCLNCSITKDPPPSCYPAELKARGQFIIAEFARYSNVLAFSAGNEVSLSAGGVLVNGVCQKQFLRDMRAYIQRCSATVRPIPIGLAIADVDRNATVPWYGCRSVPEDSLENAEFIGMNTYLHCDGTLTPSDPLPGFEQLLEDFEDYQVTIPVMLTEFGCINPTFPTVGNYQSQRNFLQVDTLFTERYRRHFVGGLVFEYNTEKINSRSPYPFVAYGEGNFGVGYLEPENCNDLDVPCVYVPFPQFDTLADEYASVDTTAESNLSSYDVAQDAPFSECPASFPRLDSFQWPSAEIEDRECPGPVYVQCPEVPTDCIGLGIPPPPPVTGMPTASLAPTVEPQATMSSPPSSNSEPPTIPPSTEPMESSPSSLPPDTDIPSSSPSSLPSAIPSILMPTMPRSQPNTSPSSGPSAFPSIVMPTTPSSSETPSMEPTRSLPLSEKPSVSPSLSPSRPLLPPPRTLMPSKTASAEPVDAPSRLPSLRPSHEPTMMPLASSTVSPAAPMSLDTLAPTTSQATRECVLSFSLTSAVFLFTILYG